MLNCDFDLEFPIYIFNWEHLTTKVVKRIVKFIIQSSFKLLFIFFLVIQFFFVIIVKFFIQLAFNLINYNSWLAIKDHVLLDKKDMKIQF